MTHNELKKITAFLSKYTVTLLSAGVHTSRAERNTKRIGKAFGVAIHLDLAIRTLTLTAEAEGVEDSVTEVVEVPAAPIKFVLNSELSALSWEIADKKLTLEQAMQRYDEEIKNSCRQPLWVAWLLISFSNSCFCALFGGDLLAVFAVAIATATGFMSRHLILKRGMNLYVAITLTAAISSGMAAFLSFLFPTSTGNIALATSVLYLIPGVPLINGILDLVEGHILSGVSRLVMGTLIILSIACGMGLTLLISTGSIG